MILYAYTVSRSEDKNPITRKYERVLYERNADFIRRVREQVIAYMRGDETIEETTICYTDNKNTKVYEIISREIVENFIDYDPRKLKVIRATMHEPYPNYNIEDDY